MKFYVTRFKNDSVIAGSNEVLLVLIIQII